ncbi:MAG: ferritin family protein [Bacteroidota bacterium]|nr:ferritin family protein [Bacteroidota bacterium]
MKNSLIIFLVCLLAATGCTSKREKTIQNIKLGIKTETTSSAKYAAYAQKAIEEGHDTIANLFKAASKAESIHASNHTAVLDSFKRTMDPFTPKFDVKTTAENLNDAIVGETYEVNVMYPMFIEDATSKNLKKAIITSLTWAIATEKKHVALFGKAKNALMTHTEGLLPYEYVVCPVCGNTLDKGTAPSECDICKTFKELFVDIK